MKDRQDAAESAVFLILGDQLFAEPHLRPHRAATILMAEESCTRTRLGQHQQKLVLYLAAMRSYADELRELGYTVHYYRLEEGNEFESCLSATIRRTRAARLIHFEIEDESSTKLVDDFVSRKRITRTVLPSPMFLCERPRFERFASRRKKLLMAEFYKAERRRLGLLLDDNSDPVGGKWSFDAANRNKLPRKLSPPKIPSASAGPHVTAVMELVSAAFRGNPGRAADFWWPTTRAGAYAWLDDFIDQRLPLFGHYQDAISTRSDTVFHSALSPLLNIGLLTPQEVLDRVTEAARERKIPLQSLEGFIRQIVGWREFVRGVYHNLGRQQEHSNFWGHDRELTRDWYTGNTGLPPLDDAIRAALELGWAHHIQRLMVAANLMTLCEIRPSSAHRWFMDMFVDSSEWVMGPNVFGMGLHSDGGVFATKPYICGSNYLLKMSDYPRGEWCTIVDGLYWRFVAKHRAFFEGNPRLALMPSLLDRMAVERKTEILGAAESFLQRATVPASHGNELKHHRTH